jgi:uncharacterized protein
MAGAAVATWSFAPQCLVRNLFGTGNRALLLIGLGLIWALMGSAIAAPVYPELTGRITDEAGLLTPADIADIEAELAAIEQTSTDQIAVVTVKSLQGYPIEDYGIGLARKWGIGQKGKDNGVLLIVAPNDRKVRIEVGRRLEPMLTDTMSMLIIENAIIPKFRRGDFAGGIRDGIRDIKSVLLGDAEEVKRRAQTTRQPENDPTVLIHLLVWFLIFAVIIWINYRNMQTMTAGGPAGARRGRGSGPIIIPGGSGDWGGGWSSGGGSSGGGGWSGGGGSFGGGGASGSW